MDWSVVPYRWVRGDFHGVFLKSHPPRHSCPRHYWPCCLADNTVPKFVHSRWPVREFCPLGLVQIVEIVTQCPVPLLRSVPGHPCASMIWTNRLPWPPKLGRGQTKHCMPTCRTFDNLMVCPARYDFENFETSEVLRSSSEKPVPSLQTLWYSSVSAS